MAKSSMDKDKYFEILSKISGGRECIKAVEEEKLSISGEENLDDLKRKQSLRHDEEIHSLRKEYLPKLYKLIITYLITVSIIIIIAMSPTIFIFKHFIIGIHFVTLSSSIIITLLTTTTANILGIFYIAVRWLFPIKN